MKKTAFFILILAFGFFAAGCGKKQQPEELAQEPMSMEALSTMSTAQTQTSQAKGMEVRSGVVPASQPVVMPQAQTETKLEPLPPSGPYKPTVNEIQTALKNAGYYTGMVDGKSGPKTKKAIEEFQKSCSLKVDGKVGPKTWAALSKYLSAMPQEEAASR